MSIPEYIRDRFPSGNGSASLTPDQKREAKRIRRRLLYNLEEHVPGAIRAKRLQIRGKPSRLVHIHTGDADREIGFLE